MSFLQLNGIDCFFPRTQMILSSEGWRVPRELIPGDIVYRARAVDGSYSGPPQYTLTFPEHGTLDQPVMLSGPPGTRFEKVRVVSVETQDVPRGSVQARHKCHGFVVTTVLDPDDSEVDDSGRRSVETADGSVASSRSFVLDTDKVLARATTGAALPVDMQKAATSGRSSGVRKAKLAKQPQASGDDVLNAFAAVDGGHATTPIQFKFPNKAVLNSSAPQGAFTASTGNATFTPGYTTPNMLARCVRGYSSLAGCAAV